MHEHIPIDDLDESNPILEDVVEDPPDDDRVGHGAEEAFDRLRLEHSAMSGRVASHGFRKWATGRRGGREPLGRRLRPIGQPVDDGFDLVARLLGKQRIAELRTTLTSARRPTHAERETRAYLAVLLRSLGGRGGQAAAVLLLDAPALGSDGVFFNAGPPRYRPNGIHIASEQRGHEAAMAARKKALRKIRELRGADYPPELVAKAEDDLRAAWGRERRKDIVRGSGLVSSDPRYTVDRPPDNP